MGILPLKSKGERVLSFEYIRRQPIWKSLGLVDHPRVKGTMKKSKDISEKLHYFILSVLTTEDIGETSTKDLFLQIKKYWDYFTDLIIEQEVPKEMGKFKSNKTLQLDNIKKIVLKNIRHEVAKLPTKM